MSYKHSHIFNILKHISFVLVLCVLILQPISDAFSCFSDVNYELVDIDWDDTDKDEKEDMNQEDEKIEPQFVAAKASYFDLHQDTLHYYLQNSRSFHSLEILIPPPEIS